MHPKDKERIDAMSAITKLQSRAAYLESGRVEGVLADSLSVRLESGLLSAKRAKSCLVAPEVGDKVLCAIDPDAVYVLSVLEGAKATDSVTISAQGDLKLQARDGRVSVCASKGVDIVGGQDVGLTGAEVHVRAKKGTVAVEEMGFFGRRLAAEIQKISLFAGEMNSVLTRVHQKAKRVFRVIEEIDQTRAGIVDIRAQSVVGIRSENTVVSARVLTKIDGEQVHIG